ncbi:MAG: amino acid ABC transporter permease [Hyphomicrobiales bacterium]
MAWFLSQLQMFFAPESLGLLAKATGMTLALTFFGCVSGFLAAFLVVMARQAPGKAGLPLRAVAILFVEMFRRIPFLVITYLVLFFLAAFVKGASLFIIAIVAISIYATAYLSEIIRTGFESVPRQQIEAAQAMNFSRWQTLRHVIVPQSWPVILPPAFAFMVAFVKDTSLVSQIGVFELAFRGRELVNHGMSGLVAFGMISLIYFLLSYPLTRLGRSLELRLASSRHQKSERGVRTA